jgi:hypothetical protein
MVVIANHDDLSMNIDDKKQEQQCSSVVVQFHVCVRPPKLLIGPL